MGGGAARPTVRLVSCRRKCGGTGPARRKVEMDALKLPIVDDAAGAGVQIIAMTIWPKKKAVVRARQGYHCGMDAMVCGPYASDRTGSWR